MALSVQSNSAASKAAMEKEVKEINKKLQILLGQFDKKERKKILRPAAKILVKAARANIKDSKKPHYRYTNASKLFGNLKAPKGLGKKVATYLPGNLRKSIRVMSFRKSDGLHVGPRLAKRNKDGEFGRGSRVDGWYAHFQEYGTINMPNPRNMGYMRRAFTKSKNAVIARIEKAIEKKVNDFARKYAKG